MFKFPYTNYHELNLDWIIEKIKMIKSAVTETSGYAANAKTSENNAATSQEAAAASQAAAAASAESAEQYFRRISENVATLVTGWMNEHITPTTPVIDSSLSISGAGADAKVTGDRFKALEFLKSYEIAIDWTAGYYRYDTLAASSGGTHVHSNVITIPAGSMLWLPKLNRSNSVSMLSECDENGTPVKCLVRGTTVAQSDLSYFAYAFEDEKDVIICANTVNQASMHYYVTPIDEYAFDGDTYGDYNLDSVIEYQEGTITSAGVGTGSAYIRTPLIMLPKGCTIEYWSCGSSSAAALSAWKWNVTIDHVIDFCAAGEITHKRYTAGTDMIVRLCARINAPTDGMSVVLNPECFYKWRVFYRDPEESSVIYGKSVCALGDSLFHGNALGTGATWLATLGAKLNMNVNNLGMNASSVARGTGEDVASMYERMNQITISDYFVLIGGANDKRYNVPLGNIDSNDGTTFYGAVNEIIKHVRTIAPKCKILLMTTYPRYESVNNIGLGDADYAEAMRNAAKHNNVDLFDNYACGVNMNDPSLRSWMDESRNRFWNNNGTITYNDDTRHFSVLAYEWLYNKYKTKLESM